MEASERMRTEGFAVVNGNAAPFGACRIFTPALNRSARRNGGTP